MLLKKKVINRQKSLSNKCYIPFGVETNPSLRRERIQIISMNLTLNEIILLGQELWVKTRQFVILPIQKIISNPTDKMSVWHLWISLLLSQIMPYNNRYL